MDPLLVVTPLLLVVALWGLIEKALPSELRKLLVDDFVPPAAGALPAPPPLEPPITVVALAPSTFDVT